MASETIITLTDSHETIDFEHHFKINAGPGAGKTTWLVAHIKNVVQHSKRLGQVKKIACITYTNVAVKKILSSIGEACECVDVNTIHAFLYKHIVKPYISFLNEPELDISKIRGHDEYVPNKKILYDVKEKTNQLYTIKTSTGEKRPYLDDQDLLKALLDLQWTLKNGELHIAPRKQYLFKIKKETYLVYKKICWSKGILHHDDILYFSWLLLEKYPSILEILRAKFPYIFVDEFQDTNPIQAAILKKIAEKESVIGVIGDKAQSIYKFQGADVTQFVNFKLNGMIEYKIEGNHRSTEEIIRVLNIIRNDSALVQHSPENRHGCRPRLLVGDAISSFQQAKQICGKQVLWTLCYKNVTSNCLKKNYGCIAEDITLEDIIINDSNAIRAKQLYYVIASIENSRDNKIKDALKLMKRAMHNNDEDDDKTALIQLQYFLDNYDLFKDKSLTEFYSTYLDEEAFDKTKISRGKAKDYYDTKKYSDLALSVRIDDDDCTNRTIHKAKGDEADSVMVMIPLTDDTEKELEFILKPNIDIEKNRVYYVALSRAKEKLFISVPDLSDNVRDELLQAGFEI